MIFNNKNILIVSPESWGKNHVSKHHYAIHLANKGNTVFFLNPPGNRFNISNTSYSNLYVIENKIEWRGLSRLPSFLSSFLINHSFARLQKKLSLKFDVIWNFDSSRYFNLKRVDKRVLKIFHIVDYTENFNRDLGAKTSDFCIGTTDFICNSMAKHNDKVFKIHHGTNLKTNNKTVTLPPSIKEKILVGYVGNLTIQYLDWSIIFELASLNSKIGFVFIGPTGKSNLSNSDNIDPMMIACEKLSNCHFLGPKPADEIQGFLQHVQILLLAYKANEHKEQLASPHKIMEYLATGNVIVSSYTDEYKNKTELIEMAKNNKQLIELLSLVSKNLDIYNHSSRKQKRIKFAMDNNYDIQIEKIEKIIKEHLKS